jgi:hypothetical protein
LPIASFISLWKDPRPTFPLRGVDVREDGRAVFIEPLPCAGSEDSPVGFVDSLLCVGREVKEVATVSTAFIVLPLLDGIEPREGAVLASNLLADARELIDRGPPELMSNLLEAGRILDELGTGTLVCNLLGAIEELKETKPAELVGDLPTAGGPVKGKGAPTLDEI